MITFKHKIHSLVRPIHRFLRQKKCRLVLRAICRDPGSLLDVGGGFGIAGEFEEFYRQFHSVTVVNLQMPGYATPAGMKLRHIIANGCALPIADKSYDWVFSNAVIEHVGNYAEQWSFASEVRRVARRGYFVATPNRYFPIEPHSLLPLYQFYPPRLKDWSLCISPGYMNAAEAIRLLSRSEMQKLFPEAEVQYSGVWSSLVACYFPQSAVFGRA